MNLNSEHTAQNYRSLGLPLIAGFIYFKQVKSPREGECKF